MKGETKKIREDPYLKRGVKNKRTSGKSLSNSDLLSLTKHNTTWRHLGVGEFFAAACFKDSIAER
jgi:hypothetical protein